MKAVRIWLKVCLLALAFSVAGCASISSEVDHTFEFDAFRDSSDIQVLRYRYGNDNGYGTKTSDNEIESGLIIQSRGITGKMVLGKSLYVKWRIKSTKQDYEDAVNLETRLPLDMKNQRIRFIIEGPQLYVYVISREDVRPFFKQSDISRLDAYASTPRLRAFKGYVRNRVIQIYPQRLIDPHIPAEFRIPVSSSATTATPSN
jgi:hypothetical protein